MSDPAGDSAVVAAAPAAPLAATAGMITSCRLTGGLLRDLGDGMRPATELAAYHVQAIAHPLLEAGGYGRQAGLEDRLHHPGHAGVPRHRQSLRRRHVPGERMARRSRLPGARVRPPRRGCEIAVRMARDLPRLELAYEPRDMPGAVAASMAAIEVVQDRYADYPSLDTPTLIADDFFHYACVLGPQLESFHPGSLRDVTGSMTVSGTGVGHGTGTDIIGDPLDVLCWLANSCAAWGTPLLAGDVVLLGSLVQTQWVAAGDVVAVANHPLGEVTAEFTT